MSTHATALFPDRHAAHAAVEQLVQAGFPRDIVSIVMSGDTHEREFGAPHSERSGVRVARSAGVLGAIVAGLVALAWENLELRVAGPLAGAILRAGESAAALSIALLGAGIAEHEARLLDHGVRHGSIVVVVHAAGEERARLALQLLELSGGLALQAA